MSMLDKIAKAILGGKVGGPTPSGIHVYHSSPHDFDKFDWSKLRTGEGANVRGQGFYFAEHPEVSGRGGEYWQSFQSRFPADEKYASDLLNAFDFDRARALSATQEGLKRELALGDAVGKAPSGWDVITRGDWERTIERNKRAIDLLQGDKQLGPRTYEVNIKAQPEQMLNLDKAVQEQSPYVQERLKALGILPQERSLDVVKKDATDLLARMGKVEGIAPWVKDDLAAMTEHVGMAKDARDVFGVMREIPQGFGIAYDHPLVLQRNTTPIFKDIQPDVAATLDRIHRSYMPMPIQTQAEQVLGSPERVAAAFRDVGVPGSRYLDAGSRRPTRVEPLTQTHNYVVNDPSKLDIMAKYGIVGGAPVGMGAVAAQDQYGAQ